MPVPTPARTAVRQRALLPALLALVMALSLVATPGEAQEDRELRAGVATREITWRAGAGQSGWGERYRASHLDDQAIEPNMSARLMKPSEGVHMPLRVKALVVEQNGRKVGVASLDLLGAIQLLHVGVAQELAEDPGIAWEDLLLVGTHTEAGPSNGSPSPLVSLYADFFDEEFARHIVTQTVAAFREAAEGLEPVRFAVGARDGIAQIGSFVRPDQPDYHLDEELGVATFVRRDGSTLASVVVYPGHFNLGGNPATLISPDGPGYVERMVDAAIIAAPRQRGAPTTTLFLPGPLGDSAVRGSEEANIYRNTEERARKLTDHVLEVLDDLAPKPHAELDSQAIYLNPPTDYQIPRFPILQSAPTPFVVSHRMHTQIVRIGDLVLGGVPGEPVMWLAKDFKERVAELGVPHPFMVSFGNDWTGYIYTRDQWHEQVSRSNQGAFGPEQGHLINDALVALTARSLGVPHDHDPGNAGPAQLADDPYYRALAALVTVSGPVGEPARAAAIVPDAPIECAGLAEARDVERLARTRFGWRGGDPAADLPFVILERLAADDRWEPVADSNGFALLLHLDLYRLRPGELELPAADPGCNELASTTWQVELEPTWDLPLGTYRFHAEGVFHRAPTVREPYVAMSEPFDVTPSTRLTVTDLEAGPDEVAFTVTYPREDEAWRWRPVTMTEGEAVVSVDDTPVGTARYDAERARWVLDGPIPDGAVTVRAVDPWGNATAP